MKTLNKYRRWLAAITCLILLTAWIPGSVFAASYIYAPEETRLLKTETRDPDPAGHIDPSLIKKNTIHIIIHMISLCQEHNILHACFLL